MKHIAVAVGVMGHVGGEVSCTSVVYFDPDTIRAVGYLLAGELTVKYTLYTF